VWHGRIVSEATLSSRLNSARTAIGDNGAEQRLIRTLPRKGVRFVGEVREVTDPELGSPRHGAPPAAIAWREGPRLPTSPGCGRIRLRVTKLPRPIAPTDDRKSRLRSICVAPALAIVLCGCAVGPDFHRPAAPADAGFAPKPLPAVSASAAVYGGAAQHLVSGQDIPFDWWTAFQSPPLNKLVAQALLANPTIEAAKVALGQVQQLVYAQQGYFFPTVGAGYNFERQQLAGNLSGSSAPGVQGNGTDIAALQNPSPNPAPHNKPLTFNFHTVQLTVGYAPDVFGSNRRQVESQRAQADMQRFEMEAAYTTLVSNVVAAAVQEVSTRAQIAATEDIININQKSLAILRNQQHFGHAMGIDGAAQEAALAQVEQTLPPLQKQLEVTRDLIRALVGNLPNQDVDETFTLESLHLPENMPVSLPSNIVEQRPDIRAAEEQMRAANANLGVAIAARLPVFNIVGTAGGAATVLSQVFYSGGPFWTLTGKVAQTLFDGNTSWHKQLAANEALIQAAAQYRSTVITAFQNVADALHALLSDADTLKAAVRSEAGAKLTLDLTQRQAQVGYVNYLTLLQAEQAYQTAVINRVQAQASRFGNTAAVFQALGGGWWHRTEQQTAAC
jgi:NodT family efflux transporter outer membrane factor (OMF) lipoprotein